MGRLIALYFALVFLLGGLFIWFLSGLLDEGPERAPPETERAGPKPEQPAPSVPQVDLSGLETPPFTLSLPIDCDPGRDCWVINYVDRDAGPGHRDYSCGRMSYDTHKGTDIALAHSGLIERNVPVLAAAAGSVVGVRDGMEDIVGRGRSNEDLDGKFCGNGVRIDHGGGWSTQYCHMKKGSLAVKVGQTVVAGDRLGSVGLSGATQFPHIHMTVNKDDAVIDPFAGLSSDADSCGLGRAPLWRKSVLRDLAYLSPVMPNAGFADRVPEQIEVMSGKLEGWAPKSDSPALIFWMEMYGVREGDELALRLIGPSGELIAESVATLERTQNRIYRAIGRKIRGSWEPGDYSATVSLSRAEGPGQRRLERTVRTRIN